MARSEPESAIRYPLTVLLGSDANIRVLRALSRHGGMLSSADIVQRSGVSRDTAWRSLLFLESTRLVLTDGSSRARVHRLNRDHFMFAALDCLFEAEAARFKAILDAVVRSAKGLEVESLFIYGSVARNEDRLDSDLDICVVAKADALSNSVEHIRNLLRDDAERLSFLPNVVGLDHQDIARLSGDDDPWWRSASEDAIVLSGKRPDQIVVHGKSDNG